MHPRPTSPDGLLGAPANASRLGWRAATVLLVFGAGLLGIHLGQSRVLTLHEVEYAQPAREMLHTGDWSMTRFLDRPMSNKPPLTHWLIATCMLVFGSRAEWVCRLPSVLAGLATAWLVAAWAARWHGRRVGLLAGLVQLTPFYVLMQARLGEPDMLLVLWVTAALACFAMGAVDSQDRSPRARRVLAWGFYAATALSFMTKWVIGPAFIACGCILFLLLQRRRQDVRFLLSPVGWVIFLAIAAPWPAWTWLREPALGEVWLRHTFGRFGGTMRAQGGQQPWAFYLYMTPALLLPWTPWLVGGVWGGAKEGLFRGRRWQWLVCPLAAGLALLSASAWKHKHYVIPVLPPLSVMVAWYLEREAWHWRRIKLSTPAREIVVAGVYAAGVWAVWQYAGRWLPLAAGVGGVVMALVWVSLVANGRSRPRTTVAALLAAFWLASATALVAVVPAHDSYRPQADLAREINRLAPPGEPLCLVGLPSDQVAYYLRWPMVGLDTVDRFAVYAASQDASKPIYVVTTNIEAGAIRHLRDFAEVTELARGPKRPRHPSRTALLLLKIPPRE